MSYRLLSWGELTPYLLLGQRPPNDVPKKLDRSYALQKYMELGVPSPEQPWTSDEYKKAIDTLNGIKSTDKFALPRRRSNKSGSVFARLADPNNLVKGAVASLSPSALLDELTQSRESGDKLRLVYAETDAAEYSFELLAKVISIES